MGRTLNILLLAAAPALSFAVQQAPAMQSTAQMAANSAQPQANNQASSHDRHHRRNSTTRHHHHHHKTSTKH
jgi:Ni/Co efflux regulator RcnB